MLKGVIFDLDGVLVDSHPIHKKAWKTFLAELGKEVNDRDLEFVLDGNKKEDILRHFLGDLSEDELRDYGHRKEMLFREEASELKLIDGMPQFLQQLQQAGMALALASSGSRHRVRYILEQVNLGQHFQAIVTGDDVTSGKPDPAIFLRAAAQLRASPPTILVVEDGVSGVHAAKAAGMRCLAVAADGRSQLLLDAGADDVVANFVGLSLESLNEMLNGHRDSGESG